MYETHLRPCCCNRQWHTVHWTPENSGSIRLRQCFGIRLVHQGLQGPGNCSCGAGVLRYRAQSRARNGAGKLSPKCTLAYAMVGQRRAGGRYFTWRHNINSVRVLEVGVEKKKRSRKKTEKGRSALLFPRSHFVLPPADVTHKSPCMPRRTTDICGSVDAR